MDPEMLSRWEVSSEDCAIEFWKNKFLVCLFVSAQLTEDFCGVEPITHPPIEIETRRPPIVDEDKLRRAYNQVDSAILGCKLYKLNRGGWKWLLMILFYLQQF